MSGFENLPQAIQPNLDPLTAEETAFPDQELSDEVALSIVLQDVATAERFRQSKNQQAEMDHADNLVRAYVKPRVWPGTDKPRANLGMPLVLDAIEKLMPTLHGAFFTSDPPFQLEPRGKTTPEAARAKGHVLAWAVEQANFKEEIRLGLKTVLQYGVMVGSWGWKTTEKTVKTYEKEESGNVVSKPEVIYINHPTYQNWDLHNIMVDSGCRTQDVRKGKFTIKQYFLDAIDLDDLRDKPEYKNIPTREQLAQILARKEEPATDSMSASKPTTHHELQAEQKTADTSVDPLLQPLEILEYWSADRVITVLQRTIVIRNEENEFWCLPDVSCAFIDVLNSFGGFGVAKLLSGEQRLEQGVINSWIDSLALILNPAYQLQKGMGAGTQRIEVSPGKVVTESGKLEPLTTPSVTVEAMGAIAASEQRANNRVGANGGSDMPNQAMRTAEGVNAFSASVVEKLQYFIEIFTDLVFVPVLEAFLSLCADKLTPKDINAILSDREGQEFNGDILDVYNANVKIKVLASSKLAAKKAAVQIVPMLITMLQSAAVQNSLVAQKKKFNYVELLDETIELLGWDIESLIQDMTDDDMKRAMAMNQAAGKVQGDTALQAQKHQDKLEEINEQGTVRAGVKAVQHVFDSAADDPQKDTQLAESLLGGGQPQGQLSGTPGVSNGQ